MRRREFEEMTLGYLDDLYAVALRLTRNPHDAEDLVQDAYLRAYGAWESFVPGSNCRAWLSRILTNSFINNYRRRRSYRKFADRPGDEPTRLLYGDATVRRAENPESEILADKLGDEVTRALGELTDDYRKVVLLADVQGLKYRDVATVLNIPVGTVMSRLFRARRQLEHKLAPYAESDYGIRKAA